jgi:hypothetical protein
MINQNYTLWSKNNKELEKMDSHSKAFALAAELAKKRGGGESTPTWLLGPQKLKTGCFRREIVVKEGTKKVESLDSVTQKAFLRAEERMKVEREKKEKKKIKLIEFRAAPREVVGPKKKVTKKQCASKTMTGKPCPFAATQGKFCKRHKIVDKDIF